MPAEPTGLVIGTRLVQLQHPTLPPIGVAVPGRLVIVGVRSPSEGVFDLRYSLISGDLGFSLTTSRALCGTIRIQDGAARVSVFIRTAHALHLVVTLAVGLLIMVAMPFPFGPPAGAGLILWQAITVRRSITAVARDAVWALGLAARGESPWRTYA